MQLRHLKNGLKCEFCQKQRNKTTMIAPRDCIKPRLYERLFDLSDVTGGVGMQGMHAQRFPVQSSKGVNLLAYPLSLAKKTSDRCMVAFTCSP